MNYLDFSAEQLQIVLNSVAKKTSDQLPYKAEIIRALQNQIAQKILDIYDPTNDYQDIQPSLQSRLFAYDLDTLNKWLNQFQLLQIEPPQQLYQAIAITKQRFSELQLEKLIFTFNHPNQG